LEPVSIVILSTVAAEAGDSSSGAWSLVTNCIINRFAQGSACDKLGYGYEWRGLSLIDICDKGFDGARLKTPEYRRALEYYSNRITSAPDPKLEEIILVCHPIILSVTPDNTGGCTLYYSPKLQAALHRKDPVHYTSDKPFWASSPKVEQVLFIPGLLQSDDYAVYRYKAKP
jgi:hypothetical protein